jgi:RNA polymerase sigma factor (sigma-70 family)
MPQPGPRREMQLLVTLIIATIAQENIDGAPTGPDFANLFTAYYPRVYNYLRYRLNSPDDVEDLISLVFEKAFTHRAQYDPAKGAFSTWLFQIARNELSNFYRSRERQARWVADTELPGDIVLEISPESRVIEQETIAQLLQGLGQLSERDQEVISLKFGSRLSNIEIGQIMELKEKTVSVVLLRAMRRLEKQVNKAAL